MGGEQKIKYCFLVQLRELIFRVFFLQKFISLWCFSFFTKLKIEDQ